MSLLLDALKKSEAQRKRGKVPSLDLGTNAFPGRVRGPGSRWALVLLLAVALVAATVWLWPKIANLVEDRAAAGDGGNATRSDTAKAETQSSSPPEGAATPGRSGESPRVAEPAPVAGAASARRVDGDAQAQGDDTPSDDAPAVEASSPGDGQSDAQAAQRAPADDRQPVRQPRPERASAAESAPKARSEPESEPEPRQNFIRPWELPQAQRAKFPDLRMSIHFYAERAADRFVRINGERYAEGQQIKPGVKLHEIRRRGAVVEFGNYRVLIE